MHKIELLDQLGRLLSWLSNDMVDGFGDLGGEEGEGQEPFNFLSHPPVGKSGMLN
jgi:hypothetical protein